MDESETLMETPQPPARNARDFTDTERDPLTLGKPTCPMCGGGFGVCKCDLTLRSRPGYPVGGDTITNVATGERVEVVVTKEDQAKSFHFFETLLDSVEDAHPGSKKFYDLVIEAALLHSQKQRDYGRTEDPFANVRAAEEWGIPGWVGAMIRANDKIRRLQTFATKGTLANEGVRDSFLDLAVYSLIALVLWEEQNESSS